MKFDTFKRAFSLTELLIVLVIVAVLFATMIPITTKRNRGQTSAQESVWMYVKDDPQKSAFFDPGSSTITSAAYIGFKPEKAAVDKLNPFSKVVIKANKQQNHIQFRIGNDGNGTLAGVFQASPYRMHLGSRLSGDKTNNYNHLQYFEKDRFSTLLGHNTGVNVSNSTKGTVVGASAGMGKPVPNNSTLGQGVSVGARSNIYGFADHSTIVGANTGKSETKRIDNTVAIGAGNLGLPESSGTNNVLMGYNVGGIGFNSPEAQNNVILNSAYYGKTPEKNTIIGYNAYLGGYETAKKFTAIGYHACSSFNKGNAQEGGKTGNITCIGYNSASNTGINYATKNLGWESDYFTHLFIGGKPNGGFPGRSVLEVHNIAYKAPEAGGLINVLPQAVGPTVVMNSHLVVRGNVYFPDSNTGQVSALSYTLFWHREPDKVKAGDRCGRKCGVFGKQLWRSYPECEFFIIVAGVICGVLIGICIVASGGALAGIMAGIGAAIVIGGWGVSGGIIANELFNDGNNYERTRDVKSFSGYSFLYQNDQNRYQCSDNYAPYFTERYCPNVLRRSDIRLKDNISENNESIAKLLLLEPYNYTYKSDKDGVLQVGVMAQDLEKILPTSVSTDEKGYKNIRWDEIFYVVINSLKSLDTSISQLDRDVEQLESDVDSVAKDQKIINKRISDINKQITKLERK